MVTDANTKRKRRLLNNVSLSVLPKEFVVLAGVSGSGKSTLIDALSGFRPASSGQVLVNGVDLYKSYDAYRNEIGYVPQQDIVHVELTVYQALSFSARLRMPIDTTPQEREKRIDQVLKELKLSERKHTTIANLSGGQKKRVSIALELLTQPNLFFLDEATSGLDPATDAEVMQILREIADSGKTVLLITHATENAKIADMVLFLAKNGNIAYWGPTKEILHYFSEVGGSKIETFPDIYRLVEQSSRTPEAWQESYQRTSYYQKYVVDRQRQFRNRKGQIASQFPQSSSVSKDQSKYNPMWSQFLILLERNFLLLFRDRISTVLVLILTPILGVLDLVTWRRDLFDATTGNAGHAITMLFNLVIVAIIAGCLSTMREIIKEADIYKRERAVGLQIMPYVLSKLVFCMKLATYQSATLLFFKYVGIELPGDLPLYYVVLFLCSLAGMSLGLLVSALAPNQNVAPLLAIVFLVPQITFGGGVLPVSSFPMVGRWFNQITLSKWPFEALISISKLGYDVANDRCWQLPKSERDQLTENKANECTCLGVSLFKQCNFPSIKDKYHPAVDEPEPQQPPRPKSPSYPPDPTEGLRAMDEYRDKVEQFNQDMQKWEQGMEDWRKNFSRWKEKRESAIGSAKGLIQQIKDDYGQGFSINLGHYIQVMLLQIGLMMTAVFGLQKRKDNL